VVCIVGAEVLAVQMDQLLLKGLVGLYPAEAIGATSYNFMNTIQHPSTAFCNTTQGWKKRFKRMPRKLFNPSAVLASFFFTFKVIASNG